MDEMMRLRYNLDLQRTNVIKSRSLERCGVRYKPRGKWKTLSRKPQKKKKRSE